ncbi:hypothetical protein Tco_0198214, partial [Tanacetum coccineum]
MSSTGELTFFLGLQVKKQQPDGIFISQDKYVADILKKFDFWSIGTASTPIESNKPLVKDEDGEDVDVHIYRSMIGSLMYPLFPSMLAQPTEDEGAPDPSPRPSSSNPIPDFIPEGSGGNHGGRSSSDRSLSGNKDGLTLQSVYDLSVSLC